MTKRILDVVAGTVLALLLTPLMLVFAIGAAISLRAWPFFTQTRIGAGGREFRIVKVRTMPPTAPCYADKYSIAATVRIPQFCQFLRTHHLDELPQLWLVPFGRMSLVGPRPEMRILHETFEPGFAELRTSVKPGCSGLWQIGNGAVGLINEAPEYDRLYVEHASVRLDLWIMWQTALMFLGLGRSHTSSAALPAWATAKRSTPAQVINLRDYTVEVEPGRLALDA